MTAVPGSEGPSPVSAAPARPIADAPAPTAGPPGASVRGEPAPPDSTGQPQADAALGLLERLDQVPVGEHVAVYDRVHRLLHEALSDLDEGADLPAGGFPGSARTDGH